MLKRGFDIQDVIHAIKNGQIIDEPEPHIKTGHLIYSVRGKSLDGNDMRIPIDIDKDNNKITFCTGIVKGR